MAHLKKTGWSTNQHVFISIKSYQRPIILILCLFNFSYQIKDFIRFISTICCIPGGNISWDMRKSLRHHWNFSILSSLLSFAKGWKILLNQYLYTDSFSTAIATGQCLAISHYLSYFSYQHYQPCKIPQPLLNHWFFHNKKLLFDRILLIT